MLEQEVDLIARQYHEERSCFSTGQKNLEDANARCEELTARCERLEDLLRVSDAAKRELEAQVNAKEEKVEALAKEIENAKSLAKKLASSHKEGNQAVRQLESDKAGAEEKLNKLQAEYEELQKEASSRQAGLEAEVESLGGKLSRLEAHCEETEQQLRESHDKFSRVSLDLGETMKALTSLHATIAEAEERALGGIGVAISQGQEEEPVKICQIAPGSPAAESERVKAGDVILSLDGIQVAQLGVRRIRQMIKGPVGSPLTIKCRAGDRDEEYQVTLQRYIPTGDTSGQQAVELMSKSGCETVKKLVKEMEALRELALQDDTAAGARHGLLALTAEQESLKHKIQLCLQLLEGTKTWLHASHPKDSEIARRAALENSELLRILQDVSSEAAEGDEARSVVSDTSLTSAATNTSAGRMCGVGMRVTNSTPHRVVSFLPHGPVGRSGQVKVGDFLVAIDGESIVNKSIKEVRRMMTGVEGSEVEIKFASTKNGEQSTYSVTIVREQPVATGK
ncbi:hypothetical protein GUITHDRAFT_142068 [Guillardia theta CCMP2712]|uniref:PDZ domain-containing protein n=1 Tax=Guillardia theta (strain CCMP2712) TaxID=905079 RepID=L1IZP7_GUITC|nr:hypothetical protein GUITHDRAFT_142068 [Guillardia theta CCMP2712]EKX41374.1 hypothetical protein GUITHDRAFT_142068 [Guillardia theta CCMP2712]|eukprot:XP_005828354.1 hypothetical protein GUITHDRAFT_142068 [Guillardia theta CCMP2712]